MYSSCASSTCNWPSRVRAWRAKMSRMSWVRSSTRHGKRRLKVAQLRRAKGRDRRGPGRRWWKRRRRQSLPLCRRRSAWRDRAVARRCISSAATSPPALAHQLAKFGQRFLGVQARRICCRPDGLRSLTDGVDHRSSAMPRDAPRRVQFDWRAGEREVHANQDRTFRPVPPTTANRSSHRGSACSAPPSTAN